MFLIINIFLHIAIFLCSKKKKVHFFDEISEKTKESNALKHINPLLKIDNSNFKLPLKKEENIKYHILTRKRYNEIGKNPNLVFINIRDAMNKHGFKKKIKKAL
ncbi:hypothetical protein CWI36_0073p0040 [Hamiltosporidium magnivora]|uniref:Uncharacterized protein n=1 Tax=Hamiltosporidium magnivora TaxID=148818 RepID=A0A4Q9LNB5_9MICR|nr:hypothetical protein CWI36_0073p0040 [Hamiltosporidium magnivora]